MLLKVRIVNFPGHIIKLNNPLIIDPPLHIIHSFDSLLHGLKLNKQIARISTKILLSLFDEPLMDNFTILRESLD